MRLAARSARMNAHKVRILYNFRILILLSRLEKHRFFVTLQTNIPHEFVLVPAGLRGDQSLSPLCRHNFEHWIFFVSWFLREINPRQKMPQQSAHENHNRKLSRVNFVVGRFQCSRLNRLYREFASVVGWNPRESAWNAAPITGGAIVCA